MSSWKSGCIWHAKTRREISLIFQLGFFQNEPLHTLIFSSPKSCCGLLGDEINIEQLQLSNLPSPDKSTFNSRWDVELISRWLWLVHQELKVRKVRDCCVDVISFLNIMKVFPKDYLGIRNTEMLCIAVEPLGKASSSPYVCFFLEPRTPIGPPWHGLRVWCILYAPHHQIQNGLRF